MEISADYAGKQVRLPFTSVEVGNDLALDCNTVLNDDGGLAVCVQAEDDAGALVGAVNRFDDGGITFESNANFTFDLRDLVSGVQRGDQFDVVELRPVAMISSTKSVKPRPTISMPGWATTG